MFIITVGYTSQEWYNRWRQHKAVNRDTSASSHIQTCGCGVPKWRLIEQVEVKNLGARETHWIRKLKATLNKQKIGKLLFGKTTIDPCEVRVGAADFAHPVQLVDVALPASENRQNFRIGTGLDVDDDSSLL